MGDNRIKSEYVDHSGYSHSHDRTQDNWDSLETEALDIHDRDAWMSSHAAELVRMNVLEFRNRSYLF